jgi:hypothetical protein
VSAIAYAAINHPKPRQHDDHADQERGEENEQPRDPQADKKRLGLSVEVPAHAVILRLWRRKRRTTIAAQNSRPNEKSRSPLIAIAQQMPASASSTLTYATPKMRRRHKRIMPSF